MFTPKTKVTVLYVAPKRFLQIRRPEICISCSPLQILGHFRRRRPGPSTAASVPSPRARPTQAWNEFTPNPAGIAAIDTWVQIVKDACMQKNVMAGLDSSARVKLVVTQSVVQPLAAQLLGVSGRSDKRAHECFVTCYKLAHHNCNYRFWVSGCVQTTHPSGPIPYETRSQTFLRPPARSC